MQLIAISETSTVFKEDAVIETDASLWSKQNTDPYELPLVDAKDLKENIEIQDFSLWRYRAVLPFSDKSRYPRQVTMGEGATPLVDAADSWPGLKLKVEYAMPTLSFKDRGAAVMLAKAAEWKVDRIVADSSGNAGTALAAYAARLGMLSDIFVPASASTGKLTQMAKHGATVHKVDGPREAATQAAQEFVSENSVFYASHIYNPYFYEGTKTFAYEVWEQLHFTAPRVLYLPVGHGTLLLGAFKGFLELLNAGLVDQLPRIIAVQAAGCAPVAEAFSADEDDHCPSACSETFAEGIAIAAPPRIDQILHAIRTTGGQVVTVDDTDVKDARADLAQMGFFVEPTAAVTFAAYKKWHYQISPQDPESLSIVPLCGAGLKAPYA